MNELYQQEFINQAIQSGVPREKVAALLQRATEIANRQTNIKTASKNIDLVGELLQGAGLQKTASSISYVQGILNEAFTSGANVPQAISITKQALDATAKKAIFMEKVSAIANDPKLSQYAEGFLASAKTAGLTHDESVSLLVDLVDREKQAGHADGDMFKQSPGAPAPSPSGDPSAPDSDPSAGSPPGGGGMAPSPAGDPSGGQGSPGASDPQEAQILQMLASLPPQEQQQIIQQLLAAISGGQGGPGGPSAGGPPPSAVPGGPGGAPQPGGPQGPA